MSTPITITSQAHGFDWHIRELIEQHHQLLAEREEVHSWILCACFATPEDMMQNAARITELTKPLD